MGDERVSLSIFTGASPLLSRSFPLFSRTAAARARIRARAAAREAAVAPFDVGKDVDDEAMIKYKAMTSS